MFWELRPQGVSSSFTQQNLPKQSLSYIGVPLGLTLLLVNLFDFLIKRRPNEIWHNSVKLVDFNGSVYLVTKAKQQNNIKRGIQFEPRQSRVTHKPGPLSIRTHNHSTAIQVQMN